MGDPVCSLRWLAAERSEAPAALTTQFTPTGQIVSRSRRVTEMQENKIGTLIVDASASCESLSVAPCLRENRASANNGLHRGRTACFELATSLAPRLVPLVVGSTVAGG